MRQEQIYPTSYEVSRRLSEVGVSPIVGLFKRCVPIGLD